MVRFFGSPTTEEEILQVKDFRDSNFNSQMEHAENLLDFKSKHELAFEKMIKTHKLEKRKNK